RAVDPRQFEDTMLELYVAASHLLKGHRVILTEEDGMPDVRVERPGRDPVHVECKRLTSTSADRLAKVISKANRQVRSAGEGAKGMVVIDVSNWIPLEERVGLPPEDLNSGHHPEVRRAIAAAQSALRGSKNRAVAGALILSDSVWLLGGATPGAQVFTESFRHSQFVAHEQVEGVTPLEDPDSLRTDLYMNLSFNARPRADPGVDR
ncbi:MAG TPA: hypothetical protein VEA99_08040, partial [Gemmatimonadaceae bacterium]|nr:hypothetical protein [Gemmatimonadaceae bacterium]